jgi:hypothetical protein
LTADTWKRDIIFLVADNGMAQVVTGFLGRQHCHQSLGCAEFTFDAREDLIVSPWKDSGMLKQARGLLMSYVATHQRAVVIVDNDWRGTPGAPALRAGIEASLSDQWKELSVIVIEPELEAWIMNDNPHLAGIFRCPDNYRKLLADAGHWPEGLAKPPRPKEALEYLKMKNKGRPLKADFRKLAAVMSVRRCQDQAFNQLREQLTAWFPVTP